VENALALCNHDRLPTQNIAEAMLRLSEIDTSLCENIITGRFGRNS
jgi:hypothetical protein